MEILFVLGPTLVCFGLPAWMALAGSVLIVSSFVFLTGRLFK